MLINIDGNNLYAEHYNEFENRPTIVFLHDSLGCVELWRDFPKQIAEVSQCNILIYDRLGYGKSDPMPTYVRPVNYLELEADVLNTILEKLKIENAILFGHSDGGSIALIAASKYPQRIKMVICEAAHIFVEEITLNGIREAVVAYQNTNLPERLQKYHGNKTETIFKAWTETWLRVDFRNWNIENLLPKIKSPLLFIQGEKDEYGTLDQVRKTINAVSGKTEKYIIPNVGHTPHKEAPKTVLDKIAAFIAENY
ncbi:alpha/beta fold hydrolase [Flavobacterium nitrogenifigens]|uniref:Pimeloyl-ACP methyl ester carboxylesterase n=1 Tax=Flavobacterium nitrogenifigens TaxID=1617283 RepID=A0A521EV95_9FLAO|nr:alpha/beta hydrolase [Flavobacterium nitrogenifigens]KAF2333375.1 alpha/beta hydrolase [Flavobacterium nitrogenifigens]SMO87847.1 Pimeloyl-ACP methyl ester carboxylesterase [Flavobacterium nitrogenifigens]